MLPPRSHSPPSPNGKTRQWRLTEVNALALRDGVGRCTTQRLYVFVKHGRSCSSRATNNPSSSIKPKTRRRNSVTAFVRINRRCVDNAFTGISPISRGSSADRKSSYRYRYVDEEKLAVFRKSDIRKSEI